MYQSKGILKPACVADSAEWSDCAYVPVHYRYVTSPIYVIQNQFDSNQIHAQKGAPRNVDSAVEHKLLAAYVARYGEAMRSSTAQVTSDAPLANKSQPDGLFSVSCHRHGGSDHIEQLTVQGQTYLPVLADWFWERDALKSAHRLVETCPASAAGLPCNPANGCAFPPPYPDPELSA